MRISGLQSAAASISLASQSWAQFAQFSPDDGSSKGISYAVNIPDSTASSKRGPIYFQMVAPKGTQWLGLGQGSEMAGANIFMMWSSSSPSNITLSPRAGMGNFLPPHNPDARITVLEGSGISPDGTMTANVRCDSCLDWTAGTMDPINPSSSWIWSVHRGDPINSDNQTQNDLPRHQEMGSFKLNLHDATGGSSSNPFQSLNSSPTNSASPAVPSNSSSSSSSTSSSGGVSSGTRRAHAILMTLSFTLLFPLDALALYLRLSHRVAYIHAPLQLLTLCLTIAGFGLGVSMARSLHKTSAYHPVIGYVVVAVLVLFQPALGLVQHLRFRRTEVKREARSWFGVAHRWLGRGMVALGVINGGLGFKLTGPVGSEHVPRYAVIIYGVAAGIVGSVYAAVVIFSLGRRDERERRGERVERKEELGYSGLEDERSRKHGNGNGNGNGKSGAYAMNTLVNGRTVG